MILVVISNSDQHDIDTVLHRLLQAFNVAVFPTATNLLGC